MTNKHKKIVRDEEEAPSKVATKEVKDEVVPEEVKDEEVNTQPVQEDVSIVLARELEAYEVPTSFEGHEITSITAIKTVGGITYAVANCDDHCTYDVPITLKQ